MKRSSALILLFLAMLALTPMTLAQDGASVIEPQDPDMVDASANISFPPPVYVLRDSVDIRGTITLASMRNYFIEFRALELDDMGMVSAESDDANWIPATAPMTEPKVDDVLGTWNTATVRDGLYELRVKINTGGEMPVYARVSPVRVENNPPDFVAEMMAPPEPTATPLPPPTPVDTTPRVVSNVNANVRSGDSTGYPVIGFLMEGDSARVKGLSSRGSGWYYIELENGRSGFIYPLIVTAEGDLENLPRINPPPLPPTPIPVPTAVPQPQPPASNGANLIFESDIRIDPHPATCNQSYRIDVTVRNNGTAASASGLIRVVDSRDTGQNPQETEIGYGPLEPGQAQRVTGHITPTQWFETTHHINLYLDYRNNTAETNENDNHAATAPYILKRGSC